MSRPNDTESEIKKVAFVGLPQSGKTAFTCRSVHDVFQPNYKETRGVDFALKVLEINAEQQLRLQIWDITGAEASERMMHIYLKETALVILFVDLNQVDKCIDHIEKYNFSVVDEGTKFVVVFTKLDLIEEQNMPSKEKLQDYTQQAFTAAKISEGQILTKRYFVTSAKDGTGIKEAYQFWVDLLLMPTIIVPKLVLPTLEKKGGLLSWLGASSKNEDEDSEPEPLVTDFTF